MKLIALSNQLEQHKNKVWQQFVEQNETRVAPLSECQRATMQQAFALSDFVLRSAEQAPELVIELFGNDYIYQQETPDYQGKLDVLLTGCDSEDSLHRLLRQFRLTEMVAIAAADMVANIPLKESLKRLSLLADGLILSALGWLTQFCQSKWGIPQNRAGIVQPLLVYGMGKLGGKELNFSSDIDLIFTYPEPGETTGCRRTLDNQQFFTRLAQKLITALNQQTVDGFVYRVDMRLRPFGESGPIVMTFNAMEDYYQEQGRDWERYAMLKARLIGEGQYHQQLTNMLRPFVYRRYIDFSVIDSLRRMKMMIAQEVRRKQLKNNIKLGGGGIREIEFIVQVFQLIRGGRVPELQQRNLLTVLPLLVEYGEINQETETVLTKAYCFLRRVENIIQALNDQQTQTLPDDELNQARILHVMQIENWPQFLTILHEHMENVHLTFNQLIGEESPNHHNVNEYWTTLWHSQWETEEAVQWIEQNCAIGKDEKRKGNKWQGEKIWRPLSEFKEEVLRRSIGNRGRQTLDKLMPQLLEQLCLLEAEEFVLERVILVLTKIVTRTAYVELLFENEGALKHLIKLCQSSLWVTEHIAKYPILLDELIDPKLLNNPPELSSYQDELRQIMLRVPEEDLEAQMEALRQFKQAQQLRIAAADISNILPITKVSDHLTALAEAIVSEVVNVAWQQMAERYGVPASSIENNHKGFAVIGYGKMGGIELGYGSDLDLVFLHDSAEKEFTTGVKQVSSKQFYLKLAQRILHIFNTRMTSGILYELDMRLRPSGNSGLLVVHVETFKQYQQEEAWTWEHQALVRARVIYGHESLANRFNQVRTSVIGSQREHGRLRQDVLEMREKMRNHLDKSTADECDIKQAQGGLVDIEFLAQYLVLKNASNEKTVMRYSDNIRIFNSLFNCGYISQLQKTTLIESYCWLRDHGHRSALQNSPSLLAREEFLKHANLITQIWQKLIEDD